MAYIGWFHIIVHSLQLFVSLGLTLFYTYSYLILPINIKEKTMSIWFFSFIVLSWINMIPIIKNLSTVIKYFGHEISDNIWNNLISISKIFKLLWLLTAILAIYFFIEIGPFFNSCGIYDNDDLACISVQMIAFMVSIGIGCIIIFMMILLISSICLTCVMCYMFVTGTEVNSNTKKTTQFLERFIPIDNIDKTDTCMICLENSEESKKEWTVLDCGHRSHRQCLANWYKYEQSCPYCRQSIEIVTI